MNTKMKVLSLIVGTAFAGSAAAVCPTSPVPPWTGAPVSPNATLAIVTGGLAGTECNLDVSLSASANASDAAVVQDDSPATEPRYRAQFIVDLDDLPAPDNSSSALMFRGTSDATGSGVALGIFGSAGAWFVSYVVNNGDAIELRAAPLGAGEQHVEFDLQIGATGSMTLWVENSDEGNPTVGAVAIDNSADVGIDTVFLGLGVATESFIADNAGLPVHIDQFDSRRTTFIGF